MNLNRLLVPLDGSDESEITLPYAAMIARRLGGEISLFLCEKGQGNPGSWLSLNVNSLDELDGEATE